MFEKLRRRNRETDDDRYEVTQVRERAIAARGGVSLGAVFTGALVAIGAFFLLSAIVGAILAESGVTPQEVASGEEIEAGTGGAIALLIALFLSFLWGGYTAGRMGRGAGFVNGLLVPIGAVVLAAVVGAVAWAIGGTSGWDLPSPTTQLPVQDQYASVDWEIALSVITLAAVFFGGIIGGMLGSRWHTKLERRADADTHDRLIADRRDNRRDVDLRDEDAATRRQHATTPSGTTTPAEDRTHVPR